MRCPALTTTFALGVVVCACDRTEAPTSAPVDARSNAPVSVPGPSASAAEAPPPQTGECPLGITPGAALGSVRIGQKRADLEQTGLPIKSLSSMGSTEILQLGPLHAKLCGGAVVDVWLDDLRKAPDCVMLGGKKVDRSLARDRFIALFAGCQAAPPRVGGEFQECEGGGLRIGHGMGDFIQVRVGKKGTRLDDTCEMLLDDGTPVPLPAEALAKLLQKTLDLDLLAPFWHADKAGRDPLHVIDNEITKGRPKLTMFGSEVVYVPRAEAEKKKRAYFEFASLQASATKATLSFRYPIEGVVGKTVFVQRFGDWQLEHKEVAER